MSRSQSEIKILQQRLMQLIRRHNEIDAEIKKIQSTLGIEDIRIYRFKREKITIKDEISRIESKLSPDIA
ncbi:MAG: YdcH family protein [Alphaproteobacteria bacterium]